MSQYKTNIGINGVEDVPIVVEYESVKAERGRRDEYGVPLEPDYPSHVEITSVRLVEDGREITLTNKEEDRMEEEIGDWLSGYYDQEPPERD